MAYRCGWCVRPWWARWRPGQILRCRIRPPLVEGGETDMLHGHRSPRGMIELIPDCLLSLERRTRFTEEQSIGRFLLPRETCQVVPKHAQGVCLARQETIVLKPGQGFLCQLPTGKKVALPILKPRQRNLTVGC